MSRRNIIMTNTDRRRLEHLLETEFAEVIDPKNYLADLQAELQRAKIVDFAEVRRYETDVCKFCCGSTSYGLPICSDCYRELGAGE